MAKTERDYILEIEKLKAALCYYADKRHYEPYCIQGEGCDATEDQGYIAREALNILTEDEK